MSNTLLAKSSAKKQQQNVNMATPGSSSPNIFEKLSNKLFNKEKENQEDTERMESSEAKNVKPNQEQHTSTAPGKESESSKPAAESESSGGLKINWDPLNLFHRDETESNDAKKDETVKEHEQHKKEDNEKSAEPTRLTKIQEEEMKSENSQISQKHAQKQRVEAVIHASNTEKTPKTQETPSRIVNQQKKVTAADSSSNDEQKEYLRAIWSDLKIGKSGYITASELLIVCQHLEMDYLTEEDVNKIFRNLDPEGSGKISFDDFYIGLFSRDSYYQKELELKKLTKTSGEPNQFQSNRAQRKRASWVELSSPDGATVMNRVRKHSRQQTSTVDNGTVATTAGSSLEAGANTSTNGMLPTSIIDQLQESGFALDEIKSGIFSVLDPQLTGQAHRNDITRLWKLCRIQNPDEIFHILKMKEFESQVNLCNLTYNLENTILNPENKQVNDLCRALIFSYQNELVYVKFNLKLRSNELETCEENLHNLKNHVMQTYATTKSSPREQISNKKSVKKNASDEAVKTGLQNLEKENELLHAELQRNHLTAETALVQNKEEIVYLKERLLNSQKEIARLETQLNESKQKLLEAEDLNGNQIKEMDAVADLHNKMQSELDRLREYKNTSPNMNELVNQMEDLRLVTLNLQEEKERKISRENELVDCKQQLNDAYKKIETLNIQIENLNQTLTNQRQSEQNYKNELNGYKAQYLDSNHDKIQLLKSENSELKKLISNRDIIEKQQLEASRLDSDKTAALPGGIKNGQIELHMQSQQLSERYEQRLLSMQQELFEKQSVMTGMKEELENLKNIRIDDELRNNQIKETSNLLENKSNTLEIRNRSMLETTKQLEDELNAKEERIRELELDVKKFANDIIVQENLNKQLNDQIKQISKAQNHQEFLLEQHKNTKENLMLQNNKFVEELKFKDESMDQMKKSINELIESINQTAEKLEFHHKYYSEQNSPQISLDNLNLSKICLRLRNELQEMRLNKSEMTETHLQLKTEIEKTRRELAQAQSKCKLAENDTVKMQTQLAELDMTQKEMQMTNQREKRGTEMLVKQLEETIKSQKSKIEKLSLNKASKSVKDSESLIKLREKEKKIQELEDKINTMSIETKKILLDNQEEFMKTLKMKEKELKELTQKIQDLNYQLDQQKANYKRKVEKCTQSDNLAKDLYLENSRLQKTLTRMEQDFKISEDQVSQLRQTLHMWQSRMFSTDNINGAGINGGIGSRTN